MKNARLIAVVFVVAGVGGGLATAIGAPILARVAGHTPAVNITTIDGLLLTASMPGALLASAAPVLGEPMQNAVLCFTCGFIIWGLAFSGGAVVVLAIYSVLTAPRHP